jgi:hypothetical protein
MRLNARSSRVPMQHTKAADQFDGATHSTFAPNSLEPVENMMVSLTRAQSPVRNQLVTWVTQQPIKQQPLQWNGNGAHSLITLSFYMVRTVWGFSP